jgi:hypothetical protein
LNLENTNMKAKDLFQIMRKMLPSNSKLEISEEQLGQETDEALKLLELFLKVIDKNYLYFTQNDEELERILIEKFGMSNLNLLNIFRVLQWLRDKTDATKSESIERYYYEFLNYGNFNLMDLNIEKIKLVLIFLKNFNNAGIKGILQFLRDLQLEKEYAYILAHFVWKSALNCRINGRYELNRKLNYSISVLVMYPFIDLLRGEFNNSSDIEFELVDKFNRAYTKLTEDVSKIPFEKVFSVVNTEINDSADWNKSIINFISGKSFEPFRVNMDSILKNFLSFEQDPLLQERIEHIFHIFFMDPIMFKSNEFTAKEKQLLSKHINNYLSFLFYHYDNKIALSQIFKSKKHFQFAELSKKINAIADDITLEFMNFRERKVTDVLLKAGYSLWTMKEYIIQMRKMKIIKQSGISNDYCNIFMRIFTGFFDRTMKEKIIEKFQENTTEMIKLFNAFKYKKNYNQMFTRLIEFLQSLSSKSNISSKAIKDFL